MSELKGTSSAMDTAEDQVCLDWLHLEYEEGGVRVCWEDIGEGICGDYDPDDPDDIPLLRFYVDIFRDGKWEEVEDASYCTQMPVTTPKPTLDRALRFLHAEYKDALSGYPYTSVKKLGERLSWISPDQFEERKGKKGGAMHF